MKGRHFIWFTGIWLYPVGVLVITIILKYLQWLELIGSDDWIYSAMRWGLPLYLPVRVTLTNLRRRKHGHKNYGVRDAFGLQVATDDISAARQAAMYPDIPNTFLSDIPQDIVLGRCGSQYVYTPLRSDGINAFCVGTPGSGKSVLLLGMLYAMLYADRIARKKRRRPFNFFLIDIKGELFHKLIPLGGKEYTADDPGQIYMIQPSNRRSFGWDVFYRIHNKGQPVSETRILKAVTDIAEALIPKDGDKQYFTGNARKIMTGILYYYAKRGLDFVPIIQKITRTVLDNLLTEIVDDAENDGDGIVLDKLKGFVGKADNESLQDVETTMKMNLDAFSYPDIVYCMQDNPNRTSPDALDDGITNLDLAIEESMLETYQPAFRLITMQVLRHAESDFSEDDDRRTAIIVDEAARVGRIDGLDSAMATLRSRHTSLIQFYQSTSQYRDIYPKEKAEVLLNLCELKIFLSGAGDKATTDYVSHMVGEYTDESISYSKGGFLGGVKEQKHSTQKRPVIDGKAMMELREKGELIAFVYGHYIRCKKLQYFSDPILKPIADSIQRPKHTREDNDHDNLKIARADREDPPKRHRQSLSETVKSRHTS